MDSHWFPMKVQWESWIPIDFQCNSHSKSMKIRNLSLICQGKCNEIHWNPLGFIGNRWDSLEPIAIHWDSVGFLEIPWNPLEFLRIHRSSSESLAIPWICLELLGIQCHPLDFVGIPWYSLESIRIP